MRSDGTGARNERQAVTAASVSRERDIRVLQGYSRVLTGTHEYSGVLTGVLTAPARARPSRTSRRCGTIANKQTPQPNSTNKQTNQPNHTNKQTNGDERAFGEDSRPAPEARQRPELLRSSAAAPALAGRHGTARCDRQHVKVPLCVASCVLLVLLPVSAGARRVRAALCALLGPATRSAAVPRKSVLAARPFRFVCFASSVLRSARARAWLRVCAFVRGSVTGQRTARC